MSSSLLLALSMSMMLWSASRGAFLTPNAHTLSGVMAVNGSNANGGCPTECVVLPAGINTCDCTDSTLGAEAITTSVLINGVVPTIDTSERNSADEFVWAAPLLTVRASTGSVKLRFGFQTPVVLCEVELYVFHCPAWGIGAKDISVFNFTFITELYESIGRVILTSDMQNCTSLTRVSIPLQMTTTTKKYFIEINSVIEWVHIAEVRFSDQPIPTTMATTEPIPTTMATTEPIPTTMVTTDPTTQHITNDVITSSTSELPSIPQVDFTDDPHTTFHINSSPASFTTSSSQQDEHTSSTTSSSSSSSGSLQHTSSTISLSATVSPGSSNTFLILVVIIGVLLFLIVTCGVACTTVLCVLRAMSEVRERDYDRWRNKTHLERGAVGRGNTSGAMVMRNPIFFDGGGAGDKADAEMVWNAQYSRVGEDGGEAMASDIDDYDYIIVNTHVMNEDRAGVENSMRDAESGHVDEEGGVRKERSDAMTKEETDYITIQS